MGWLQIHIPLLTSSMGFATAVIGGIIWVCIQKVKNMTEKEFTKKSDCEKNRMILDVNIAGLKDDINETKEQVHIIDKKIDKILYRLINGNI